MRDFRLNGGFAKRKRVIFGLNGGFSKRKRVIFVYMGDFQRENVWFSRKCVIFKEKMRDFRVNVGLSG